MALALLGIILLRLCFKNYLLWNNNACHFFLTRVPQPNRYVCLSDNMKEHEAHACGIVPSSTEDIVLCIRQRKKYPLSEPHAE